ncbi:hypothetical protein PL921430058 [Planktothrix tepida PCC 9214]|uniref:Uncharacterized protein n=1 Tax=Planktothrix tepida PCC 9214 TaxID=671072 RepID=A0A1J1LHC4_9CYAN|nr:hypothetical protein PL921430058 [Planktothrix tepida PCC 9214]
MIIHQSSGGFTGNIIEIKTQKHPRAFRHRNLKFPISEIRFLYIPKVESLKK